MRLCVAIYRLYSSHVEARYWHLKDCLLHIRSQEILHRKSINCQSSTQAKAHCQSCSLVVGSSSNPSLQLYYQVYNLDLSLSEWESHISWASFHFSAPRWKLSVLFRLSVKTGFSFFKSSLFSSLSSAHSSTQKSTKKKKNPYTKSL